MKTKENTLLLFVTGSLMLIAPRGHAATLLDTNFNPGTGFSGSVSSIVLDGTKILVGGYFTSYNGQAVSNIVRLNSDGSLDTSFQGRSVEGVETIALQQISGSSRILIGGQFTAIRRFNNDGSADGNFSTTLDHYCNSIAVIPGATDGDTKIVIGGEFTHVNNTARTRIARLSYSGNLDTGFDPSYGANNTVYSVAVDPNNKVVVGGAFTILGSQGPYPSHSYIGRLTTSGAIDTTFASSANGTVYDVRIGGVAANNRVLVGGTFTTLSGSSRTGIGSLVDSTGSQDSNWTCAGGATVWAVSREDARGDYTLVGGSFGAINGQDHAKIARISTGSGCPDANWNPGETGVTGGNVYAITVQGDGKILIGGSFTAVDGTSRNGIARLNP